MAETRFSEATLIADKKIEQGLPANTHGADCNEKKDFGSHYLLLKYPVGQFDCLRWLVAIF